MREVLLEMNEKKLGVACVINEDGSLTGIITDGDLRRVFESKSDPLNSTADETMTKNPKNTSRDIITAQVLNEMERFSITALPVVDNDNKLIGLIHIHDLIKLETGR
jgi:arabinose-5-phosphate isomerase